MVGPKKSLGAKSRANDPRTRATLWNARFLRPSDAKISEPHNHAEQVVQKLPLNDAGACRYLQDAEGKETASLPEGGAV